MAWRLCLTPHTWINLTVKKIQVSLKLELNDAERQRGTLLSKIPLITTEAVRKKKKIRSFTCFDNQGK